MKKKSLSPRPIGLLISCEHGGNRVPRKYRTLLRGRTGLLRTHRAYDPGALTVARAMAQAFSAPLFVSTTSRLLVDLNRSIGHPKLYCRPARTIPAAWRRDILQRYYLPYRIAIESESARAIAQGWLVVHISSHSFTPQLNGEVRNADVGLLYDPQRHHELELAVRWRAALRCRDPALRVRRNYPYTGTSDGLTAYLRRRLPPEAYVGLELELNQRCLLRSARERRALRTMLIETLEEALPAVHADPGQARLTRKGYKHALDL